jgi:hypothetical protein
MMMEREGMEDVEEGRAMRCGAGGKAVEIED